MSNNETWTKQLKAYADERGWTVSWGIPIQRIGNGNYTVLWKVTCTVEGIEYTAEGSSEQKATEASSEAAWKKLVRNPNDG